MRLYTYQIKHIISTNGSTVSSTIGLVFNDSICNAKKHELMYDCVSLKTPKILIKWADDSLCFKVPQFFATKVF